MRVIGLTGGIASGKSCVASLLAAQGIPVIDADQLARDAVKPGSAALDRIVSIFGPGVLEVSGSLDRVAMAEIIFANPDARKKLEEILHPAIRMLAEEQLAGLRDKGEQVVVYMAPLLIEAGITGRVDEVWVVHVEREMQVKRLMERDLISREAAEQRISAQMPMSEKRRYGAVIIENHGTLRELEEKVLRVFASEISGGRRGAADAAPRVY